MKKTMYLECYSGISGDMMAAALLDLGADQEALMEVLESLPVTGFHVEVSRVKKAGIDACDFNVVLDEEHENHDHDMEYLHGHIHDHAAEHIHNHTHEHIHDHAAEHIQSHAHEHTHDHGGAHAHAHHHAHRSMKEIREILGCGQMTEGARALALKIFGILAEAEGKAHNMPPEEVHFHEVGAVDSIVDIVSAAVCMDNLGIRDVIIPVLCEGTGTVRCQHGILPIPVPAVANIITAHGLNVQITDVKGEFVTPTGAAIAAAICTADRLPQNFKIRKIGIGAGKRTYERPSLLRAMLIESPTEEQDTICKLESNIDDCSGEVLGYVMEKLFEAGARDVHYIPVYMKKNRPGWQVNIICKEENVAKLEQVLFKETTTIGIRRVRMERTVLGRRKEVVKTVYGEADVKVCELDGEMRFYPEYESVVKICRENDLPYSEVYRMIQEQCIG